MIQADTYVCARCHTIVTAGCKDECPNAYFGQAHKKPDQSKVVVKKLTRPKKRGK